MGLYDIPDHPVIRNCERTGYPDGKTPPEPTCPVCEQECYEIYQTKDGDILGCDNCVDVVHPGEAHDCPACGENPVETLYIRHGEETPSGCDQCVDVRPSWECAECYPDRD